MTRKTAGAPMQFVRLQQKPHLETPKAIKAGFDQSAHSKLIANWRSGEFLW